MEDKDIIQARMLSNIDDKYDKSKGQFFYDATKPVAIELERVYLDIEDIKSNMDLFNKEGNDLDTFITQRSRIQRKKATKSSGVVIIEGSTGTQINRGILVASDGSDYIVLEDKKITDDGKTSVKVECTAFGSSGNCPSMQINQFPITISGLTKVYNLEPFTDGFNKESDDSFRDRYMEYIRLPITSGNKNHYKFWAREVIGVGEAKVISLWDGDNTVKVIISDANGNVVNKSLISTVQEYIDPGSKGLGEGKAPIGAFCTVVSVNGLEIDISVDILIDKYADEETITKNFREEVENYFKEISFRESKVYLAQIECIIYNIPGVKDRSNLLLNDKNENVELKEEDIPVLNEVIFNVTRE